MDMMRPQSVAMPPVAPSGLMFTDNGDGTAKLAWTDNSIAETGYVIQVSTDGVNWLDFARTEVALTPGPNSTGPMSYVLNSWAMGDQYRVVAENTVGDTFDYANPNVNEIGTPAAPGTGFPHVTVTSSSEVVIVGGIAAPGAPTGLTATLDTTASQVDLAWTDNATTETGYVVERSDNGGAFAQIATLPGDSVSYSDITVASGNHYEYQVAAVNAGGSSYSNIVAVDWTGVVPDAPTNLAATVLSATQVQLDWTDNATTETGYIVERSENGGAFLQLATLAADAVTYTDNSVAVGNSYVYQVAATNAVGNSAYSDPVTVSIALPPAPLNLSATNVTRSSFTLNWEYPFTQPDGFEIQVSTNSSFTAIVQSFPDVGADLTSQDISGLSRNTRYYVRIRGISAVGVGTWSATLQVRTSNR
jgi:fibronectin type 3 domain-containing protein